MINLSNYYRFKISCPRQASEYVWARTLKQAEKLAISHYNTNEGVSVELSCRYEFAMRLGAAQVRTHGNTIEECLSNIYVRGFIGERDVCKDIEAEFIRQKALILIAIVENTKKLQKIQSKMS